LELKERSFADKPQQKKELTIESKQKILATFVPENKIINLDMPKKPSKAPQQSYLNVSKPSLELKESLSQIGPRKNTTQNRRESDFLFGEVTANQF
jgi:hypothetical protein